MCVFSEYRIRGNFRQFRHVLLLAKFLSCVNDYVEDMATFTALARIYSTEYFCNTKVAGLGENFVVYDTLKAAYYFL